MNQWYVYPSTSPKIYADIQTELTFTGSLLSKKVVADMTQGYQYFGTSGEKSFSIDFENAPKRGFGSRSDPSNIEYCRVMWVNGDKSWSYAFEWTEAGTKTANILSSLELPIPQEVPKAH